jgi:positive regulator of sigma E activity
MPYKDPQQKRQWEEQHRDRRLARRRELRRAHEARRLMQSTVPSNSDQAAVSGLPWVLLVGGSGLAYYSPPFGLAAGGLTVIVAMLRGKGWQWRIIGAVVILLSLFLLWKEWNAKEIDRPGKQTYLDEKES